MSSTNDYMNKVIRQKDSQLGEYIFRWKDGRVIPIKVSWGYHYGDLGKGRDTYFWNIESSNRSTGHFGTGTYFFGKRGNEENPIYKRDNRPLHKVNFNEYHLFKPKNDNDAFILHRGLRAVNYFTSLDKDDYENMRIMMITYGIKGDEINRAYDKVRTTYYSDKYQKASYNSNLDSMSTVFMKELGYNGIDVRELDRYDNSSYGSVIYDLDKKKSGGK